MAALDLDLERLARTYEGEILGAVVCGSHLWGTNRRGSDVDIMIITNDCREGVSETTRGKYDLLLMSEDYFRQRIRDQRMLQLAFLWVPEELVIKEYGARFKDLKIKPDVLQEATEEEQAKNKRTLHELLQQGELERAKKVIACIHRYNDFTWQLLEYGEIRDYQKHKDTYLELMRDCCSVEAVARFVEERESFRGIM